MSVVNLRFPVNGEFPEYDIYIGRRWKKGSFEQTKWANPFTCWDGSRSREESIALFKEMFWGTPDLYENVHELEGKVLACHCKPYLCHGDFLVQQAKKRGRLLRNEQDNEQFNKAEEKVQRMKTLDILCERRRLEAQASEAEMRDAKAAETRANRRKRAPRRKLQFSEEEPEVIPEGLNAPKKKKVWSPTVSPLASLNTPLKNIPPNDSTSPVLSVHQKRSPSPPDLVVDLGATPVSATEEEEDEIDGFLTPVNKIRPFFFPDASGLSGLTQKHPLDK